MEKHKHLVQVLDLVEVERFVDTYWSGPGRPQQSRRALARAFIAKAIWDLPTTRDLIDRIEVDAPLRRLCGWSRVSAIPSEATFSRAFAAFSEARLAERMHEALVKDALGAELIGHVPLIDVNPRRDTALKQDLKREARAQRACGLIMPELRAS